MLQRCRRDPAVRQIERNSPIETTLRNKILLRLPLAPERNAYPGHAQDFGNDVSINKKSAYSKSAGREDDGLRRKSVFIYSSVSKPRTGANKLNRFVASEAIAFGNTRIRRFLHVFSIGQAFFSRDMP